MLVMIENAVAGAGAGAGLGCDDEGCICGR